MEEKRNNMLTKDVLIGIFIKKEKILSFLEFLKRRVHLDLERVFVYNISTNLDEYLVTFKTNNKKKYLQLIHYSSVMHVKNGCIFSINALNKFIEEANGVADKTYKVDWENLRGKLIILNSGELKIADIEKIDDKSVFFK